MRSHMIAVSIVTIMLINAPLSIAATEGVEQRTHQILNAYAVGDIEAMMPLLSPDISIYGSDDAEVMHGIGAFKTLLESDLKLWGRKASIGSMQDVTVVKSRNVESIFFDAAFSVGNNPPVLVRFAMVWKKSAGSWKLVQSSNVVPTHGQSAAALLEGH